MKPVVKGLLIGCGVLILAAGVGVILLVRFWNANKDKIRAQADAARTEAREFGRNATDSQCVAKALERYRNDRSIIGEAKARVWLAGCLETSQKESGFCDNVPSKDEIMRTVTWRLGECSRLGFDGDKGCTRILTEVQDYCEGGKRRAGVPAGRTAGLPAGDQATS